MKRTELFFSVLLVPVDFCAVLLGAWLAYRLRLTNFVTDIRPVLFDVAVDDFMMWSATIAAATVLALAALGLYQRKSTDSWFSEFVRIIFATSTILAAVIFLFFLRSELFSSRFLVLAGWGASIGTIAIARLAVRGLQRALFRYGYAARRVAVIGSTHMVAVTEHMQRHPESGYRVVANCSADDAGLVALRALLQTAAIDDVLFLEPELAAPRQAFLELAEEFHIQFRYVPELLHAGVGVPTVRFDIGVPVIEVMETTMQGWGRVLKRLFDIVVSIVALIVLLPIFILAACAVVADTGFPIVYTSTRVGRGRSFTVYKFRSMHLKFCTGENYGGKAAQELHDTLVETSSDRSGPVPKVANDPRITRVGWVLRRYSIDELPQLLNVLRGDMSLVGPRPHLPWEVARYERHHRKVLAVKPGMTGLAQVSGRSDLDFEDEVRLDRYYIEHWHFGLDLLLLARTIPVIFRSRRVL